ncbi:hypothetical protein [Vulcanisaeta souniana]|uniref:Uncharacterized protein n=1 Tax=Vulcanisaeta souniana JCM 11219 TaxID=1293586 RepID=A0ABN6STW9_9CREN|nr:hypothetical protein [Vulcanisaeta souniana]BDR93348.1 hypothetical protein Vsou_24410 [Vulcanisaeta souniana JCM 11219]
MIMAQVKYVRALVLIILTLSIISILILLLNTAQAQPTPIQSIKVNNGVISYYESLPSMAPGIVIRVYVINGSTIKPVNAFVSIYANLPNGVTPMKHTYGSVITLPFNESAWSFIINKWLGTGMPVNDYNTSLLVFVTYISGNDSWVVPIIIPYNVGWVLAARDVKVAPMNPAVPRYIVVSININVNTIKPFKVIQMKINSTGEIDPQVFGSYGGYVLYNCSVSGPQPEIYMPLPYEFIPESTCLGINGTLPLAWVTWDKSVRQYDNKLLTYLGVYYSGTVSWDALATNYGDTGTSYSTGESWTLAISINMSSTQGPGSLYWAYGGTWALVKYDAWYVDVTTGYTWYLGSATVSEILYVPRQEQLTYGVDYGNGPISTLYYGAIAVSKGLIGYPVLNASSVIDYASFTPNPLIGAEQLSMCNGPVYNTTGTLGTIYYITLGGIKYAISTAQLGTGIGSLAAGIASLATPSPYSIIAGIVATGLGIASIIPPSSSTTITNTQLELLGIAEGTNLYISVMVASKAFGIPTFGFILNATNYYENPTSYSCKYGKVVIIS